MRKTIIFDMDGTVYDLYGVDGWLEMLKNSDTRAYSIGKPKVNLRELEKVCQALISVGYTIGVITWLAKNGSEKFNRETEAVKRGWIKRNMPYVKEFTAQPYGTPKQKALSRRFTYAVLVDDNEEVRKMWETPKQRKTINANEDIIEKLWELV